jgi:hypothetical protein
MRLTRGAARDVEIAAPKTTPVMNAKPRFLDTSQVATGTNIVQRKLSTFSGKRGSIRFIPAPLTQTRPD